MFVWNIDCNIVAKIGILLQKLEYCCKNLYKKSVLLVIGFIEFGLVVSLPLGKSVLQLPRLFATTWVPVPKLFVVKAVAVWLILLVVLQNQLVAAPPVENLPNVVVVASRNDPKVDPEAVLYLVVPALLEDQAAAKAVAALKVGNQPLASEHKANVVQLHVANLRAPDLVQDVAVLVSNVGVAVVVVPLKLGKNGANPVPSAHPLVDVTNVVLLNVDDLASVVAKETLVVASLRQPVAAAEASPLNLRDALDPKVAVAVKASPLNLRDALDPKVEVVVKASQPSQKDVPNHEVAVAVAVALVRKALPDPNLRPKLVNCPSVQAKPKLIREPWLEELVLEQVLLAKSHRVLLVANLVASRPVVEVAERVSRRKLNLREFHQW